MGALFFASFLAPPAAESYYFFQKGKKKRTDAKTAREGGRRVFEHDTPNRPKRKKETRVDAEPPRSERLWCLRVAGRSEGGRSVAT